MVRDIIRVAVLCAVAGLPIAAQNDISSTNLGGSISAPTDRSEISLADKNPDVQRYSSYLSQLKLNPKQFLNELTVAKKKVPDLTAHDFVVLKLFVQDPRTTYVAETGESNTSRPGVQTLAGKPEYTEKPLKFKDLLEARKDSKNVPQAVEHFAHSIDLSDKEEKKLAHLVEALDKKVP